MPFPACVSAVFVLTTKEQYVEHGGALPGFGTLLTWLPEEGVAIAILINAIDKGAEGKAIRDRIIRSVTSWPIEQSIVRFESCQTANYGQLREQPTGISGVECLSPDPPSFEGIYYNPGYGAPISLCDPSSVSEYCTRVKHTFSLVDSYTGRPFSSSQLLAEWPRVWRISHLRLSRRNSSSCTRFHSESVYTYAVEPTALFPLGHGEDKTPFEVTLGQDNGAEVRFVVLEGKVKGLGVFGTAEGVEGGRTEREKKARNVEEGADVWFDRI